MVKLIGKRSAGHFTCLNVMIKIKANSKELADQEKKIVFNIQTYVQ